MLNQEVNGHRIRHPLGPYTITGFNVALGSGTGPFPAGR